jgi:ribosome-associated toxin RatA of RatAB toxin-antitoxin module
MEQLEGLDILKKSTDHLHHLWESVDLSEKFLPYCQVMFLEFRKKIKVRNDLQNINQDFCHRHHLGHEFAVEVQMKSFLKLWPYVM